MLGPDGGGYGRNPRAPEDPALVMIVHFLPPLVLARILAVAPHWNALLGDHGALRSAWGRLSLRATFVVEVGWSRCVSP